MRFPITIGLRRSRILDTGLLLVLVTTIAVLLAWPAGAALQMAAIFMAMLVAGLAYRRLTPRLAGIRLERVGGMRVCLAGQTEFRRVLALPGATVHPWLTVVRLQDEDGRRHMLLVAPDAMSHDDFRRLRVFLRWQAKFSAAPTDA